MGIWFSGQQKGRKEGGRAESSSGSGCALEFGNWHMIPRRHCRAAE